MTWGLEDLEAHAAEFEGVSVLERREGVIGLGLGPQANGRSNAVPEFQVAGEKISVKMGQEDVADVASVLGGILQVLVDVALRIDDDRRTGHGVGDQVRGVRQTAKVVLFQQYGTL